ncbi:MAG: lamin tail domain-containing protein [Opitutaceae bacterium]|nr:lamin tail domain-containing protein [Verrucomicrobiales bacterium]
MMSLIHTMFSAIRTFSRLVVFLFILNAQAQNGAYREIYNGLSGNSLFDLTNAPAFPNAPTSSSLITSFAAPQNAADNYGQRIRAYLIAPVTTNYTFWIASDDASALFLSTSDLADGKQQIAFLDGATTFQNWTANASQQSAFIPLVGGQRYYIEALMKEGGGSDHLSVGWQQQNGFLERPIASGRLRPFGLPAPLIVVQPQNVNATEGNTVSFAVSLAPNLLTQSYRWQSNGVNISGATASSYVIPIARLSDSNGTYRCVITNYSGSITSVAATLNLTADVTAPTLVSAVNVSSNHLLVTFSERVDPVTAISAANYVLNNGASITTAEFTHTNRTILLTTSALQLGTTYTLTVSNVRDQAQTPNTITPGSAVNFTVQLSHDYGGPAVVGSSVSTNGGFVVTAGGGIAGSNDQFHILDRLVTGDFDFQVRVESLDLSDVWAKAGLMARESYEPQSRFAAVFATPSVSGCSFQSRTSFAGAIGIAGNFPVNPPYTWLRLQRSGNDFTGYASLDGSTWSVLGTVNMALVSRLYFGPAVASQNSARSTTSRLSGYTAVVGGTVGRLNAGREPLAQSSRRTHLVISEIMYHPAIQPASSNELEYVEIFNPHGVFEDVSGFRLSGEIDYTFPPGTILSAGAFVVVAKQPAEITAFHGITNVLGPFSGTLNNSSGTLQLINRNGQILLNVDYSDATPFPAAADGAGHSLILANPSYGEGDAQAWGSSTFVNGSPGRHDPIVPVPQQAVLINEFLAHTDDPELDFIELYNHSNQSVSLAGCVLTDDPSTNKFVIGAGVSIGARGFLSYNQNQLGFSLNADGETLFLKSADGKRVLDSIRFGGQENGTSTGRSPDGSPAFHELLSKTPGQANSGLLIRSIVINEIMYNPISGNSDDEFIELHNRGISVVDLGGWRLLDAVNFSFATNTVIQPGGYLVVARNSTRLLSRYPSLNTGNTVGNFNGTLSNNGERIALARPDQIVNTNNGVTTTNTIYIVTDEVSYRDGGLWGIWSDGGGSSLELIDARSDNRRPSNWSDSDETAKSSWTTVQFTGLTDFGNTGSGGTINELHAMLLGGGECLIDNLEVIGEFGTNVLSLTNSTFEFGLGNWVLQGNHVRSSHDNSEGFSGASSLRIRATSGGDNGANRIECDLTAPITPNTMATIRGQARWLRGQPNLLLRLFGNSLEASGTLPVPTNLGTPGAVNSRAAANVGPAIFEVTHNPVLPAAGEAVLVTGRIHDSDGISSFQLSYRLDPSITSTLLTMSDNGTGGDVIAGDGVFSAIIPGQTNSAVVAFYLVARDNSGALVASRFPSDAPARECLVRFGESLPYGNLGTYRVWVNSTKFATWRDRERLSNEPVDATFTYGDYRIIYNIGARYRGSPFIRPGYSSPTSGAVAYVFGMPEDDLLLGSNEINLDSLEPGKDETSQREKAAFWIADQLGVPFSHERHINLIVNGVNNRSRGVPVYSDSQQPNSDYIEAWFPDDQDGEIFKIDDWFEFNDSVARLFNVDATLQDFVTTNNQKKQARYRWNWERKANGVIDDDYSSLFNLVDAVNSTNSTNFTANVESLVNVDEWMRVFAVRHVVGDWDGYGYNRGKNMFSYKPRQGKWHMLLWDMDFALGDGDGATTGLFNSRGEDTGLQNLYNHPPFRRTYLRAMQDAAEGPLVDANLFPILDATHAMFLGNGAVPTGPTVIKNYVTSRRNYILQQIAAVDAPLAFDGADLSTNNNLVTLSGTAPVGLKTLNFNGIPYPLTWITMTNWTVRIPLPSGPTTLVVQGYNSKNQPVAGASDSLIVTVTSSPVDPAGQVVINEIMYHPATNGAGFLEIHNANPTTSFDLSNWRLDGVDFNFPPGTILIPGSFLVVVQDPVVFASVYGNQIPMAGQYGGAFDKGGETIRLIKPGATPKQDELIDIVRYDDDLPWPMAADGAGPSLQLIDPQQDNFRVANWAAIPTNQAPPYHTPGVTNSVRGTVAPFPALWINEVQPLNTTGILDNFGEREPWIELHNPSASPLSLNGLFLTDQFTNLTRWAFPAGSSINPGQFLVIWADGEPGESTVSQFHTTFRLTNGTGSIALVRTNASGAHVLDYVNFTGVPANRSYGSYPDGQPVTRQSFHFVTPGLTNNPASSPVQVKINEWVASNVSPGGKPDPADNGFEDWFELFNPTTNTIDLSGYFLTDALAASNKWAIPTGITIGPRGYLLVWADGEPLQNGSNGDLHADFSLGKGGEEIGLFAPDGTLIDSIGFGPQSDNISEGRFADGANNGFFLMTNTTPRTANIYPEINNAPTISSMTATTINEGSAFVFNIPASDPDGPPQSLAFRLLGLPPAGATLNATNGILFWIPGEKQGSAVYTFTVRVTDNGTPALSATNTLLVTVNDVNSPPTLAAIPRMATTGGGVALFTASSMDFDDPSQGLAYSLDAGAPPGANIGASTGQFIWNVQSNQPSGTYAITVRVTDNGSPALTDSQAVLIDVNAPFGIDRISLSPGGDVILRWQSLLNGTYRIQSTETLTSINWTNHPSDVIGNGTTILFTNPPGPGSERYYRVIQITP